MSKDLAEFKELWTHKKWLMANNIDQSIWKDRYRYFDLSVSLDLSNKLKAFKVEQELIEKKKKILEQKIKAKLKLNSEIKSYNKDLKSEKVFQKYA